MKHAHRGSAAGEDAAAVDGVHVDAVARGRRVSAIGPAGRTPEVEGEGVVVRGGPFGDDVRDDAFHRARQWRRRCGRWRG